MTNKELQKLLSEYPDDMKVKLYSNQSSAKKLDFDYENIIIHSDTAFSDSSAPQDEWDCEDGKLNLGDGERHILINPPIY